MLPSISLNQNSIAYKTECFEGEILNEVFGETKETVSNVLTVHDALDCCIDRLGAVNLNVIASLSKVTEKEAIVALQGAIYYDPEKTEYVTSDEYLSGNILTKIKCAKECLNKGNVPSTVDLNANITALQTVMPMRVNAGQIKVSIGSPWIPPEIYSAFIIALIGIKSNTGKPGIHVEYIRSANHYIIRGKKYFSEFTRAKLTYGTSRFNAFEIIERMLNSRELVVYDTYSTYDERHATRKVNKAETLLVQERAKQISERFSYWLFRDEPRKTEMLELYNENFCTIRPRHFDGSKLTLPGKNPDIKLQKYQLDAIKRVISSKNILLAHQVGAGKTYVMAAAVMEMRRLGISKRNLIIVPNNILEQWHNEFLHLYPDAAVLMVEPKSFTPQNRNNVLKSIIECDYDAIIMSYTSFSLIPLSCEERERELISAQEELTQAMHDVVNSDAYTVINRCLMKNMHKLQKIWEVEPASTRETIYFDDLGISTLFVDEAHNFKNISIETRHGAIPGLNTKGSKRCDDLMAKLRFIQRNNDGRGAVFATGTPITNSVSDLYTMQRYLGYERMESLNLLEFDNWVKMFSEVTEELEIEANGSAYRLRKRLSRYYNLPELSLLFSDIADMYFPNDADKKLPSEVETINCIVNSSDALREYIGELANRAEHVKSGDVARTEDNMLKITTDGRKAALDMRLVDSDAADEPNSKLNTCVRNVFDIWRDNERLTQLIFLDQSTPKEGFNLYDDIKDKLIKRGVPSTEIAFVHDAINDSMRVSLFNKVRKGKIRILIGSTFKLGTGSNVQNYLVAVHHLDIPWRPSDVIQRDGRMLRQGNKNDKVRIYRYITNGSFDAYSWQLLENKQRFISQIVNGDYPNRTGNEIDEVVLTYSEVKSLAVGNPLIKRKIELENELQRKQMLRARFEHRRIEAGETLLQLPARRAELKRLKKTFETDIGMLEKSDAKVSGFEMVLMNELFRKRREAGERLIDLLAEYAFMREPKLIGSYRGFELYLVNDMMDARRIFLLKGEGSYRSDLSESPMGVIARMDNCLNGLKVRLDNVVEKLEKLDTDEADLIEERDKESGLEQEIIELRKELVSVNKQLGMQN